MNYLIDNDRLTTKNIAALAEQLNLNKEARTYRSWLNMFSDAMSNGRMRFEDNLATSELLRFPGLKKSTGGGSGNETYYYIDIDEGDDCIDRDTDENSTPQNINFSLVNYRKTALDSRPFWLMLGNYFARTHASRSFFLVSGAVLLTFLSIYSLSATIYFVAESTTEIFLVIFPLLLTSASALLVHKYHFFYKLFEEKIRIIDTAKVPAGVCFLKVLKLPEPNVPPRFIEYSLEAWLVTADCPICFGRAGIQDSVSLMRKSAFDSEIIGICSNNPKMHQHTFDKDTMRGSAIKRV